MTPEVSRICNEFRVYRYFLRLATQRKEFFRNKSNAIKSKLHFKVNILGNYLN